jgi:hypothetical protein
MNLKNFPNFISEFLNALYFVGDTPVIIAKRCALSKQFLRSSYRRLFFYAESHQNLLFGLSLGDRNTSLAAFYRT